MSPTRLNPTANKGPNKGQDLFEATSRKDSGGPCPNSTVVLRKENQGHFPAG